jgi:hypothetical protein
MSRLGIDYAWQHPSLPGGCSFVLRYLSNDPSKNLTRGEADSLRSQGQDIGVVWETTTNEVDGGHDAGVAAAQKAEAQAAAAGMPAGSPIYFAVDYDAQVGPIISAYFQGVAEVLGGVRRVGVYGGYRVVSALLDAGLVAYIWQTSAWSQYQDANGKNYIKWDPRCHIQQYAYNNVYDWNRTDAGDFGQWGSTGAGAAVVIDYTPGARMLKVGDRGPDVADFQNRLRVFSDPAVVADGTFGPATDAAVRVYQASAGLTVDGVIGADTWKALPGGAIGDKYHELGGAGGILGKPIIIEKGTLDNRGRTVWFDNGAIYWTAETGAHVVKNGIREHWGALGWELSYLGYPMTDEAPCADGVGYFSRFEHGSILWSPTTGAASIRGAFADHFAELGYESGLLGYPTADQVRLPDGRGQAQTFQHGVQYWTPETGAHEVHGSILAAWAAEKWEAGILGYPTSDEWGDGAGGRVSSFQGADLLASSDGHVHLSRQVL